MKPSRRISGVHYGAATKEWPEEQVNGALLTNAQIRERIASEFKIEVPSDIHLLRFWMWYSRRRAAFERRRTQHWLAQKARALRIQKLLLRLIRQAEATERAAQNTTFNSSN